MRGTLQAFVSAQAGERELREQRKERIANKARRRTELDAAWGD